MLSLPHVIERVQWITLTVDKVTTVRNPGSVRRSGASTTRISCAQSGRARIPWIGNVSENQADAGRKQEKVTKLSICVAANALWTVVR
jgi:hypothetical protein